MQSISKRELQVLTLLAAGQSNRSMAEQLSVCEATIAMHIQRARKRLHATTREHAVAIAVARGLIDVPVSAPTPANTATS